MRNQLCVGTTENHLENVRGKKKLLEKCTRIDTRPIDACKRVRVQIETIGHNIRDAFIYILFPARQMNVPFGSSKAHTMVNEVQISMQKLYEL